MMRKFKVEMIIITDDDQDQKDRDENCEHYDTKECIDIMVKELADDYVDGVTIVDVDDVKVEEVLV